jgi:hypothetical protein
LSRRRRRHDSGDDRSRSRWSAAQWPIPLASASSRSDRLARVCGGTVDTMNVGSRAPACPLLILRCEREHTAIQDKHHRSGRRLDWFPNPGDLFKRKRDHIPNSHLISLLIRCSLYFFSVPPICTELPSATDLGRICSVLCSSISVHSLGNFSWKAEVERGLMVIMFEQQPSPSMSCTVA